MSRTTAESPHTPELCAAAAEAMRPRFDVVDAAALLPAPPEMRAVVRTAFDAADLADAD